MRIDKAMQTKQAKQGQTKRDDNLDVVAIDISGRHSVEGTYLMVCASVAVTISPEGIEATQIMLGDSLFLFYQEEEILDEFNSENLNIQKEEICYKTVTKG